MCQARRDGGRRCPIHRHDSVAVITLATKTTDLTKTQVEHAFRELTREGRGSADPTAEQWQTFKQGFRDNLPVDLHGAVIRNLDKADEHSTVPDGKTFYALSKINERANTRNTQLTSFVERVAAEKGYSATEVQQKFKESYEGAQREHGQGRPDDYSQSTYAWARSQQLPYDTQSVVALDAVRNLPARAATNPRVTRMETGLAFISEIGYNAEGGRLEVKLGASDQVLAYRNVPASVYQKLVQHDRPTDDMAVNYIRYVQGKSHYQYANAEQDKQDSVEVRCAGCGQFASPMGHSCPTPVVVETTAPETAVEAARQEVNARTETAESDTTAEADISTDVSVSVPEATVEPEQIDVQDNASIEANNDDSEKPDASELDSKTTEDVSSGNTESNEYDPADPKPVWGDDQSKRPEVAVHEVITYEDILNKAGFAEDEKFGNIFNVNVQTINPKYAKSFDEGDLPYFLNDSENADEYKELIKNHLSEGKAVRLVIASREGQYYDDTTGRRRYRRETRIYSVNGAPYRGALDSTNHGDSYAYVREGRESKIGRVLDDANAYVIDRSGEFDKDTYGNEVEKLRADGAPVLNLRSTYTKAIRFDANVSADHHAFKIPTINELRRTLKDNDRFYMPLEATTNTYSHNARIDDQGHMVRYGNMDVSGFVEYKKGEDGKWSAEYNHRSLKCQCFDYRENYNCQHVDSVLRKANNILYQSGALTASGAASSARINLREMDNGQYLTPALARRPDMTVTAPNEETGEPLRYKFTQMVEGRRASQNQNNWYGRNDMYRYYDKIGEINSFQDYLDNRNALNNYSCIRSFSTVDKPRDIQQALKKGGIVEIPVSAHVSRSGWGGGSAVTGTVDLKQGEDDSVVVHGHSLKCYCSEYQEKYDCIHVRATLANSVHVPYIGTRDYDPEDTHNVRARNRLQFGQDNAELSTYIRMGHHRDRMGGEPTEAELRAAVKEEIIEEERREREREERERQRRVERMEQQREYYARRAKSYRQSVADFKEANPDYAKSLDAHRENLEKKWDDVESSYVQDKEKLDGAIKEALQRKAKGEDVVPFRPMGGVLDGASEGEAGRKFGVELEFEIKSGTNKAAALRAIAKDLHEAGLTERAEQTHYHSAANNGYRAWSFEEDCTVHGELVSPILDDSPESWRQLNLATEIIKKHGGTATTKAGSHVHVSTGSYEMHAAKSAELLRLSKDYEDITYRLASNPSRGKHRGTQWCRPNLKDDAGDLDTSSDTIHDALGSHGHGAAVNIGAVGSNLKSSNAEFRVWDGTLDSGVIQAQVMMSVAMVDRAEYNVLKSGKSQVRASEHDKSVGSNKTKGVDKNETHNEGGIAEFLDIMFRKDEDKNQIASLFAVTNWQDS